VDLVENLLPKERNVKITPLYTVNPDDLVYTAAARVVKGVSGEVIE
jgi:hypothetical protein